MLRRIADLIVNEYPDLKIRKELDTVLDQVRLNDGVIGKGIETNLAVLNNILQTDGYLTFTQQSGWLILPKAYKFEGYVDQYWNIFWRKILLGIWHLAVSIIVPLSVAYWTVKFTTGK